MSDKERAQLFRVRAAELREIVPTMNSEEASVQLLRMALSYDTLAIKLEGAANDTGPSDVHQASPDDGDEADRRDQPPPLGTD